MAVVDHGETRQGADGRCRHVAKDLALLGQRAGWLRHGRELVQLEIVDGRVPPDLLALALATLLAAFVAAAPAWAAPPNLVAAYSFDAGATDFSP